LEAHLVIDSCSLSAGSSDAANSRMASQSIHETLDAREDQTGRRTGGLFAALGWRGWTCVVGLVLIALLLGYWGSRQIRPAAANLDLLWQQAEQDLSAGRFESVDAVLKRLERSRPPTPLDWFLRAQLAMARKEDDQALEYLARVPDEHYMAAQARLVAGQTELRRNRVRLAEEWFQAALKLDPRLIQAHRELIYIYGMQLRRAKLSAEFMALSRLTNLSFDNAFHWGLLRNNSWEPGTALGSLAAYAAADPLDRWSRLAIAENYRRMGRLDDADAAIGTLASDDFEAIALKGRIALDRQDHEEAERLLALGPRDQPLLARLRGTLALGRRDVSEALANFRIAYDADRENREALFGLIAALELSHDDKAVLPLREIARRFDRLNSLIQRAAVAQARRDADLMRQIGEACAALDRKEEARAWYKLAIGLDPLDSIAQQALFRLNETPENHPQPSR
jgi:tetratricopeptide (TPR) repeat protein